MYVYKCKHFLFDPFAVIFPYDKNIIFRAGDRCVWDRKCACLVNKLWFGESGKEITFEFLSDILEEMQSRRSKEHQVT